MKLLIDNLDGAGALDYSAAVCLATPGAAGLSVERKLNAPSTLRAVLFLDGTSLPTPSRQARVRVLAASGLVIFTGYVVTEPAPMYAGAGSTGAAYRLVVSAVSDEWLLDKQTAGAPVGRVLGASGASAVLNLLSRTGSNQFVPTAITGLRLVGVVDPAQARTWSGHVRAVGDASYSSYRVVDGAITFQPGGAATHTFDEGDGSLEVAALRTGSARELSNDVTVSGAKEPATYWTELFSGDGTSSTFALTGEPASIGAGRARLIEETFSGTAIDTNRWAVADPGSHLSLSGAGLSFSGGNGFDGQTTLTSNDALELGGSVVLELKGVSLAAGSAGVLGGLYSGATSQANCLAGFSVKQANGATVVIPLINGVEAGTSATFATGHTYTLRMRLMSRELVRVQQVYYAMIDGQVETFGGGLTDAPLALVLEIRDEGASSNTASSVLYDGTLPSSPATASVVAVNSIQLQGTLSEILLERTGSAWVRSTPAATGTAQTRLIGVAGDGSSCRVTSSVTGAVTFFAGQEPQVGESVAVTYRGARRAVARVADPYSIAREAAGGGAGTARWIGHVAAPPARSSVDCEAAASAILAFATNRGAATSGSCIAVNPAGGDVWPGDVLNLCAGGKSLSAVVREVKVESRGGGVLPTGEVLVYSVRFANEWAEGLGLKLTEHLASDAQVPAQALNLSSGSPNAVAPHTLANLGGLQVIGTSGSGTTAALNVDAGCDPPAGGGFEVRRRDAGFGAGAADLVLRSPVRGFLIPRGAFEESFFVRMYDSSSPPLYSRESAAIVTHLPLS